MLTLRRGKLRPGCGAPGCFAEGPSWCPCSSAGSTGTRHAWTRSDLPWPQSGPAAARRPWLRCSSPSGRDHWSSRKGRTYPGAQLLRCGGLRCGNGQEGGGHANGDHRPELAHYVPFGWMRRSSRAKGGRRHSPDEWFPGVRKTEDETSSLPRLLIHPSWACQSRPAGWWDGPEKFSQSA